MSIFNTWLWTLLSVSKVHALLVDLNWSPLSTLHYVSHCASIPVDENDCIIGTFVNLVSQSTHHPDHHGSSVVSTDADMCGPPSINYNKLNNYFDTCLNVCMVPGSNLTVDQAQESLAKISQVLTATDCWNLYCQERERAQQESLALQSLERGIVENVAPCSNVTLDLHSCLVSTSFSLLLENILQTPQGLVFSKAFQDSRSGISTSNSSFQGIVPDITAETILDLAMQGSELCQASGVQEDIAEILQATTTLRNLFTNPTCWSQKEENYAIITDDNRSTDMWGKLYLKKVIRCAGIEIDFNSCVENTLFDEWDSITADLSPNSRLLFHPTSSSSYNKFEEMCGVPMLSTTEMEQAVDRSKNICLARGVSPTNTETQLALQKVNMLLRSESCWFSRCNPKLLSTLKYDWMQQCSNVTLPASLVQPFSVMPKPHIDPMDSVLGCMVDFVMSSQPASFGLFEFTTDTTNTCIPPMFAQRNQFCSIVVGPTALSSCYKELDEFENWDFSMSYQYYESFSLSYEYKNEYSMSYRTRPFYETRRRKSQRLINDLCTIVEVWSGDEGKKCFLDACTSTGGNSDNDWPIADKTPQPSSEPRPSRRPVIAPMSAPETKPPFPVTYHRTDVPQTGMPSQQPIQGSFTKTHVPLNKDLNQLTGLPVSWPTRVPTNVPDSAMYKKSTDAPAIKATQVPTTNTELIPIGSPATSITKPRLTNMPLTSNKPTIKPRSTNMPTLLKSNKPTIKPSNSLRNPFSPTRAPTKAPSSRKDGIKATTRAPTKVSLDRSTLSPVVPAGKGTVAVSVQAKISLSNLNETQLPAPGPERNTMVRVLELAILQTLPTGAKCRILRIGSIAITQRLLRELSDGLSIDFEVTISQTCEDATCLKSTSLAENLYSNVTNSLKDSVSTGEISKAINVMAASQNVTVLKEATLDTRSFVTVSKQVTVVKSSIPTPIKTSNSYRVPERLLLLRMISSIALVATLLLI